MSKRGIGRKKAYDRPASTQQRGDQQKSAAPTLSANHAPTDRPCSFNSDVGASESNSSKVMEGIEHGTRRAWGTGNVEEREEEARETTNQGRRARMCAVVAVVAVVAVMVRESGRRQGGEGGS